MRQKMVRFLKKGQICGWFNQENNNEPSDNLLEKCNLREASERARGRARESTHETGSGVESNGVESEQKHQKEPGGRGKMWPTNQSLF